MTSADPRSPGCRPCPAPRPGGHRPVRRPLRRRRPPARRPPRRARPASPSPWLDVGYLTEHAARHRRAPPAHRLRARGRRSPRCSAGRRPCAGSGLPLVVTVHQLRSGAHPRGPAGTRQDAHLEAVLGHGRGGAHPHPRRRRRDRRAVRADGDRRRPPVDRRARSGARRRAGPGRAAAGVGVAAVPDPASLVRAALSGAVSGGGRLRVLVDAADLPDVDPAGPRAGRPRGAGARRAPCRRAWTAQLQQLHVAVLPERRGTHSRDLEICRDVGTRVVAPAAGWLADQWSEVVSYGNDEHGALDPVSLTAAVSVGADPADAPSGRPRLAGGAARGRPAGARRGLRPGGRATAAGPDARCGTVGAPTGGRTGRTGVVGRGGVEPPTSRFSGERSYRLSYLPLPVSRTGERP